MNHITRLALLALSCVAIALGGCSPYTLKGKVITGDISYAALVDKSDVRLSDTGVPGVAIELWTDPEKLNRKQVATAVSDNAGEFSMSVSEVGAGFLNYDCAVIAKGAGLAPVSQTFRLPPSSQRLLIIVRKGPGDGPLPEDLMEEFRRYSR